MTTKKQKLEATVATVKAAAGRTWFDCSDEDSHIELSSRAHGDVGNETAGQADKVEGARLLKLVRKVFKPASWVVTYDVVDEWVSVCVRTLPLTKEEKAKAAMEKKMTALRVKIQDACMVANAAITKPNVRQTFVGSVINGHGYFLAYFKIDYGTRILYRSHLGADYAFATLEEAEAALQPLLAQFPDLDWRRKVMEPRPRHTYNYSPPNNVIENAGAIEFEFRISAR
jgi:hypothetical protein